MVDVAGEYFLTFLMQRKYCRGSSSLTKVGKLVVVLGELARFFDERSLSDQAWRLRMSTLSKRPL